MAVQKRKKRKFTDYLKWFVPAYIILLYIVLQIDKTDVPFSLETLSEKIMAGLSRIFVHPFDIFPPNMKLLGVMLYFGLIALGLLYVEYIRNKRLRTEDASGSASWNDDLKSYNKTYTDPKGKPYANRDGTDNKNIILTNDVFLSMSGKQTMRNLNVLVTGGSGSGKSRFVVKPNILQANCSFVVTDPKGELLATTGDFLKKRGYKIKVFNLSQMEHSCSYNPFNYIRDENGVLTMITALIQNTTPKGASKGDPFWGATRS